MSAARSRGESLLIRGPAGSLEVLLERPGAGDPAGFAVICHPHPLQGGTLNNKVVYTLARVFQELGLATLRFNFRGVGASTGGFDDGRGEVDDALAVIAHGRTSWPAANLSLAGFSFGAVVALTAAARADPRCLVCVAPPVMRLAPGSWVPPACPWLIVQGDADQVVDPGSVQAFARAAVPAPSLALLPGVDHFFHGRLQDLRDTVMEFCKDKTR